MLYLHLEKFPSSLRRRQIVNFSGSSSTPTFFHFLPTAANDKQIPEFHFTIIFCLLRTLTRKQEPTKREIATHHNNMVKEESPLCVHFQMIFCIDSFQRCVHSGLARNPQFQQHPRDPAVPPLEEHASSVTVSLARRLINKIYSLSVGSLGTCKETIDWGARNKPRNNFYFFFSFRLNSNSLLQLPYPYFPSFIFCTPLHTVPPPFPLPPFFFLYRSQPVSPLTPLYFCSKTTLSLHLFNIIIEPVLPHPRPPLTTTVGNPQFKLSRRLRPPSGY